jgi:hypothetical protein
MILCGLLCATLFRHDICITNRFYYAPILFYIWRSSVIYVLACLLVHWYCTYNNRRLVIPLFLTIPRQCSRLLFVSL